MGKLSWYWGVWLNRFRFIFRSFIEEKPQYANCTTPLSTNKEKKTKNVSRDLKTVLESSDIFMSIDLFSKIFYLRCFPEINCFWKVWFMIMSIKTVEVTLFSFLAITFKWFEPQTWGWSRSTGNLIFYKYRSFWNFK